MNDVIVEVSDIVEADIVEVIVEACVLAPAQTNNFFNALELRARRFSFRFALFHSHWVLSLGSLRYMAPSRASSSLQEYGDSRVWPPNS